MASFPRFWSLTPGSWSMVLEMLECWKAGKLGSPKVYNSRCYIAFELSSLIAFQPPGKTPTFEPQNPELLNL